MILRRRSSLLMTSMRSNREVCFNGHFLRAHGSQVIYSMYLLSSIPTMVGVFLLADEPLTAGLPHLDLVDDLVTIVHIIGAHQPTSHPPSKAPNLPQIVPFAGHLVGLLLHLNGRAASHRNRRYQLKQKWIEGGFVVSAVTRQMPRTTQLWTDMHRNRAHLA